MCKLSEEKINANYLKWIEKLKKYDAYSEEMINDIGEKLKNSSFGLNDSSGGAYRGAMIDVTLNMLCVLAAHISENSINKYHPFIKVNSNSLIKVLLLQHISKAVMFVDETAQWKLNKGIFYGFNENLASILKCGERTIFMCMKYGIKLTEEEYEAIRIMDKEEDKSCSFNNPMAVLVRFINQLVFIELRRKWLDENKGDSSVEK